jgi:peptide/nickel transport system substrate-binding protein
VFVTTASVAAPGGAATQPKQGGTLTFLFNAEPPGMDPIQLREVPQISPGVSANAIFDQLLYTDAATLKVKPKIATSLTTPDKGLTWVLKLHPNVKFSDGTAYDAAAVQYNWQRIADPANKAPFAQPAQEVASYDIPDPLTLKATLKAPDPLWDQLVARNLATIGSPTALKANATAFQTKPVGAGPYLLKEWVRGVSMTFVRNPTYWQKGKPYLDEIDVKTINDDAARQSTMLANAAQAGLDGAWQNIEAYKATGKYDITNTPANGGGYAMAFNVTKAPFNDIRVRQAISLTLSSKEIVQRSGDGDATWVMSTIDEKFSPFYNPKLKLPKTNVAEAQKLIDSYVADNGGKPVSWTHLSLSTLTHQRIATAIQAILTSRLKNVDMKLDIQSSVTGVPRQAAGDFQSTLQGPRWTDPSLDDASWFSSTSTLNYMRYSNPTVDSAVKQLQTAVDIKAKQQAHDAIIQQVLKDVPVVWVTRFRTYYAYDKTQVKNFQQFYELRPLLEEVWMTKAKS